MDRRAVTNPSTKSWVRTSTSVTHPPVLGLQLERPLGRAALAVGLELRAAGAGGLAGAHVPMRRRLGAPPCARLGESASRCAVRITLRCPHPGHLLHPRPVRHPVIGNSVVLHQ